MLFSILVVVAFVCIFFKVLGLLIRAAWSLTKVVALVLLVPAVPFLIGCFLMTGGLLLLMPLALVLAAWLILRWCV